MNPDKEVLVTDGKLKNVDKNKYKRNLPLDRIESRGEAGELEEG